MDHWATVQFFFSLAQVRCFWRCFCFRSGLVALFLKMSERSDSWCTDSSISSLLVKLSQFFNWLCLTVFSSLQSSLLLVHIFLSNFFLPVNFTFNFLWYSTPWRATPFSNDPLWLTLFVEGINDHLLDHCQVSSVPHYCGFKEQEIATIFWDTDFWLSLAVCSNHRKLKQKSVIYIYEYMKVSLSTLFCMCWRLAATHYSLSLSFQLVVLDCLTACLSSGLSLLHLTLSPCLSS